MAKWKPVTIERIFIWSPLAVALGGVVAVAYAILPVSPTVERAQAQPEVAECDADRARRVAAVAIDSGLVETADLRDGGLVLVIRRSAIERMSHREQATMAAAFDCSIAGDGKHLQRVMFRSTLNGSDLVMFQAADLMRIRSEGR